MIWNPDIHDICDTKDIHDINDNHHDIHEMKKSKIVNKLFMSFKTYLDTLYYSKKCASRASIQKLWLCIWQIHFFDFSSASCARRPQDEDGGHNSNSFLTGVWQKLLALTQALMEQR